MHPEFWEGIPGTQFAVPAVPAVPGTRYSISPHHVTQRENRRQRTFFNDSDYRAYIDLMSEWCSRQGGEIWAYCLMPNHVHVVAVPSAEKRLPDAGITDLRDVAVGARDR